MTAMTIDGGDAGLTANFPQGQRNSNRSSLSADALADKLANVSLNVLHDINRRFNKDLLTVSSKDRNAMTEEIHGVSTLAPEESPELLEHGLWELSNEIAAISSDSPLKAAYMESQILPDTYVNTADFRLRFLRCELFDAKKAATRMLTFLNHASYLFGPQVLERPIRMDDFTKKDQDYMKLGNFQILPFRDRTGRPIYAWVGDFGLQHGDDVTHKVGLYMHWIMSNDVENQKKGAISLIWHPGKLDFHDKGIQSIIEKCSFKTLMYNKLFFDSIPLRWAAVHEYLPNTPFYHAWRAGYGIMTKGNTSHARVRYHTGEDIEIKYHLKTYGIPVESIPVHDDGKIKIRQLKQWMPLQAKLERNGGGASNEPTMILYPGTHDVLFRKADSLLCHPGNSLFKGYIESRKEEHSKATQKEKTAITYSIIQMVQEKGGRFLEWHKTGWWTEIDGEKMRVKVANQVKLFKLKKMAPMPQKVQSSTGRFQNQDNIKRRKIRQDAYVSDSDGESTSNCARCSWL